ncbi:MAG: lytic transglycosylase domain-containing protein [Arenimonas sp.]
MKFRALLMFCTLAAPVSAFAGTLYKCVGMDGITNYSSKRVSGAVCKSMDFATPNRVSVMASARSARAATPASIKTRAAGAASVAPTARAVDFRTSESGTSMASKPTSGGRVTRGAVYKFTKDGVTHYTNVRPKGATGAKMLFSYIETCYACAALPNVNFGTVRLNTDAYAAEIRDAATRYGVDEAVVRAIIHAESAFRPDARSHAGAQGLMQLIPATAARFGVANAYDPKQNISGGVQYLAWLMKRFNSDLSLVAAGYNAGEGAVQKYGGIPPYAETQRYVQRVGQLAERYRGAVAAR